MARKQALSGGNNGRPFSTDIGYMDGKSSQPRFYLGTNQEEAENRRQRLQELWDSCRASHWTAETFAVAQAIRRGEQTFPVSRPEGISDEAYFQIVTAYAKTYRGITFIPADAVAHDAGEAKTVQMVRDFATSATESARTVAKIMGVQTKSGHSFYSTLDDFSKWILENMKRRSADPIQRTTSKTGIKLSEAVLRLKDSHPNLPLDEIDLEVVERIAKYWKDRPASKTRSSKGEKPIAVDTVVNHIKALRRWVKFVNKNRKVYGWVKPEEVADSLRVDRNELHFEEDISKLLDGADTFTLAEIKTLYAAATDLKRLMILCGINFGFAESEMNSFLWNEFREENGRHIIQRVRRKTKVPGEFVIWPETWKALQWWQHQNPPHEAVFVSDKGKVMTESRFACNWQNLLKTVNKDGEKVRPLPLKHLRKTAAEFMMEYSTADEIAVGIFQCRGKPVPTDFQADKYYRRRYIRVFEALEQMYPKIAGAFDVPDAFSGRARKRGGSGIDKATIAKIQSYAGSPLSQRQIGRELGVSTPTIRRHMPATE